MLKETILLEHGSGGRSTNKLIDEIFAASFSNDTLNAMEDAAVIPGSGTIAMTTDSFVVTPVEFPGGDIGRLCVCGTVNDLLMRGAVPKYLTCGFIIKEGTRIETLKRVVNSLADTAREAGVIIVAGDTKVIDADGTMADANGEPGGILINTTGVGFVPEGLDISAKNARPGDVIIASGNMGDHHAAILSQRLEIVNDIQSDNAPLSEMVLKLIEEGITIRTLRDVTRGGLATVLKELAVASNMEFDLEDKKVPVSSKVKDFAGLLGLDPLYMGNEGKLIAIVAPEDADRAVEIIRSCKYGEDACIIGQVKDGDNGNLLLKTSIGGIRKLDILEGEGLPRIC